MPAAAPAWVTSLLLVPVGLAGPLVMPPTTAALLAAVPAHRAGTASGVFNTSRQLGGALAVAVLGTLLGGSGGFAAGLRTGLVVTAVVAVAAAGAGGDAAAGGGWGVTRSDRPARGRPVRGRKWISARCTAPARPAAGPPSRAGRPSGR